MNNKSVFRLISIAFLSGICISGLIFLSINTLQNQRSQKNKIKLTSFNATRVTYNSVDSPCEKIDINQASLSQLVSLPGIGETKAIAIIDFREKYGAFEDISELSYVTGIGNTLLKSIQDLVIIN